MKKIRTWVIGKIAKFRRVIYYCIFPEYSLDANQPEFIEKSYSSFMMILWGVLYGLILSVVFAISWKCFGDIYFSERSRLRLIPSIFILFIGCLVNFNQLLGIGKTIDRLVGCNETGINGNRCSYFLLLPGILAIFMFILIKFSALLAMPYHAPWWPADWRRFFNRFYPQMHFRVLILLGMWGKLGFIIACSTGQTSAEIDDVSKAIRRGAKIRSLLGNIALVFIITAIYFSSWRNRAMGLLVSFVIFLAVYLVSMIISWRLKGHDKYSMFACSELAEVLLLLAYLAVARFL